MVSACRNLGLRAVGPALGAALVVAGCGSTGATLGRSARVAARITAPITFDASSCASGWKPPPAGLDRFTVANRGARSGSVTLEQFGSGIAVAQATDLGPGAISTVSARLAAGGDYQWSCRLEGAQPEVSAVGTVPGTATHATVPVPAALSTIQLIQPLSEYRLYVEARLRKLRAEVSALQARIGSRDLAGARSGWLAAHLTWLEIGQDDGAYGAFGSLGGAIDGLPADIVGGSTSPRFTGFHKVESDLFVRDNLTAAASDAHVLARLIRQLTPDTVDADLPATIAGVDAWVLRCHEILEDALRDTLTDDDDDGSHTELASLTADVTATREMLSVLAGVIAPRARGIVPSGARELAAIDDADAAARRAGTPWRALGALPARSRQLIDSTVGAALETLAPVSELLQVQGADS